MNTIGYFEIQSSNPEREIKFYKTVFGWNFIRQEHVPIEYYSIETGGINGGLLKRPVEVPPMQYGTNAYVNSVEVANFDTTADLILSSGGKIAMPKFAIPGRCYQGYFLDEDNNTFGVFEANEHAQ